MSASLPEGAIGLSNTELQQWKRCPRRWFVEHFLCFLPADEAPHGNRQLGIRVHTALEGHYGYGLDPGLVLDLLYRAEITEHPEFEKELRSDWELAKIMVAGYLDEVRDKSLDATLKVVLTEADVAVPLPGFEGVYLRGKLDQVTWDTETGWFSFLDHKTADSFERHEVIEMDPQMKTYALIQWLINYGIPVPGELPQLESNRPLVNGGIVNTLRRVKRTKQSKPPYYDRHPFRYTAEQLASHLLSTQQVASEILSARQQLSAAYQQGGTIEAINYWQRRICRPVPILHDCRWSCPLVGGLCPMMDDGSAWAAALEDGDRFVRADPYARYTRGGLDAVQAQLGRAGQ